jgi:hypothetical protein
MRAQNLFNNNFKRGCKSMKYNSYNSKTLVGTQTPSISLNLKAIGSRRDAIPEIR